MAMQSFNSLGFALLIALLLCLNSIISAEIYDIRDYISLPETELSALQDLLTAWSQTPHKESNLPGWSRFDPATAQEYKESDGSNYTDPCYYDTWGGVYCYIKSSDITTGYLYSIYNASVVDLVITDASIVGTLPNSVWNFENLISVTLTGNPQLTGPIPSHNKTYLFWTMKNLDLHGNNFTGLIPRTIANMSALEDLDLSDNSLSGEIPSDLGVIETLRTLKLFNNTLSGSVPEGFFENTNKLVAVDLSCNILSGPFPNLTGIGSLHTLNISHNALDGELDPTLFNSSATNYSITVLDLSNNRFSGPIPDLSGWSALNSVKLRNNNFNPGPFPTWLKNLKSNNLQVLSLSNTSLTGDFDISILNNFLNLVTLELDDNSINGTLNITSLSNIANNSSGSLQSVSLMNNKIQKVLFASSITNLGSIFKLQGNPYCSDQTQEPDLQRCVCTQQCYDTGSLRSRYKQRVITIAAATGGCIAAVLIALIMSISILFHRRSEKKNQYLLDKAYEKFAEFETKPTIFAYSELKEATRDFHDDMKLGEGGFGAVYKGTLADGSEVAVKQLFAPVQQEIDDFLNEVITLTSVKQRNLVKLKGCCLRGGRRLLVYEYVENYDLGETLFEHKGNQLLNWAQRLDICLGVARGLQYLHTSVEPRIIHRDIKANNVLLDKNLQPKIADFGLALLYPNEKTHITIAQVAGTKGYLAPEYASLGRLSDKVDVFSYGVLALEVVSGRRNIDFNAPPDEAYLTEWAWKLYEGGRIMDIVDPTLSVEIEEQPKVLKVLTIALSCLQASADLRPSMAHVVAMLEGIMEVGCIPSRSSGSVLRRSYHTLEIDSSATGLAPVYEESLSLFEGTSSSGDIRRGSATVELGPVKAR